MAHNDKSKDTRHETVPRYRFSLMNILLSAKSSTVGFLWESFCIYSWILLMVIIVAGDTLPSENEFEELCAFAIVYSTSGYECLTHALAAFMTRPLWG